MEQPARRRTSRRAAYNLPAPVTTFVGRRDDLVELPRLLERTRLLTLTGAGGVGKTRLAIELATEVAGRYPAGVWLVELAALADPELVVPTLAAALRLPEQAGQPLLDAVIEHLRSRHALLIIDNCEHLIGRCAEVVAALLQGCPRLQVLATSREPLGIAGETDWRVPSLRVPPAAAALSVATEFEGLQLFLDRARAAQPTFQATEEQYAALVEICTRLDGIPLALELAAARVKALSPQQIAARLADPFALLATGSRVALPRQQTLHATIDWSYALLADEERAFLNQLAVFAGGWTLDAAEALTETPHAVDLLARLVDKSLVLAEVTGSTARYRMLEPVRQFALEQLRTSGGEAHARDQHLAWAVAYTERFEPALRGPHLPELLDELHVEQDNLRGALEWSWQSNRPDLLLRRACALTRFWWIIGSMTEGRTWLARGLATPTTPLLRMRAQTNLAWLAHYQGDLPTAEVAAQDALRATRSLDDRWWEAWLLHLLGRQRYFGGDPVASRELGLESLRIAQEVGDPWLVGWALHLLGLAAHIGGDFAQARAYYLESWSVRVEIGGNEESLGTLGHLMGLAAFSSGDSALARSDLAAGLALFGAIDCVWTKTHFCTTSAALAVEDGNPERAVRLIHAGHTLTKSSAPHIPLSQALARATLELARQSLSAETFAHEAAAGAALSFDQAMQETWAALDETKPTAAPTLPPFPEGLAPGGSPQHEPGAGPSHPLSQREIEVLRLLAAGHTTREIADALTISVPTVDRHITHVYAKLGVRRRVDAVTYAMQHGLT